ISEEAAVEAGLLTPPRTGEDGRPRPRFRGRLMFPIRDPRGQVVGFGARKLSDGAWGPKYLNSPQTELFNKGELLFVLWEAREAIRDAGFGLLVEGYTDVLSLHQAGVQMAVATLGTALTPQKASLLERYARGVVVALDGDGAGERAALRGQRVYTVEGRARAVEAVLPILAQVASAVELEGYVRRLSRALDVSEQALWADLDRYRRGRSSPAGLSRHGGTAPRHTLAGQ